MADDGKWVECEDKRRWMWPGCESVVEEGERRRILWLMAGFFKVLGCMNIKARLPGAVPPQVILGSLEPHRPDLTCLQPDRARTPIILEVATLPQIESVATTRRWELLASAAQQLSAELHFVVPEWSARGLTEKVLRRRLSAMELSFKRVWTV